ncbi:MAG: hypothetical protein OIF48_13740 [Silicimonas sp.]|nr:hypothetical protein [Silicimonas sp.]
MIKVDGGVVMQLDSANVDGAMLGPCAATAATTCLCKASEPYAVDDVSLNLAPGEHTIEITFVEHPVSNGLSLDWAVNDLGRRPMDLTVRKQPTGSIRKAMANGAMCSTCR